MAPLGDRTAAGLGWLVLQTLGSKVAAIVSQIVLAWLLVPKQFGTVGLAFTVSALAGVVQQSGLGEIIVQRGKHLRRWESDANWISLALGCCAAVIMVIAAPLAARAYRTPGLTGLVLVLAASAVFNAMLVVPVARLRLDLNFRGIATFNFAANLGIALLCIAFAAAGLGTYSLVLPRLIVVASQVAVLGKLGLILIRPVRLRRVRLLMRDSVPAFISALCLTVIAQGDYISLGIARSGEVVGFYYFGFNLAAQMIVLLTLNLSGVLLPALSKLNDEPARQLAAFRRACKVLAAIGIFASFLQAILAGPVVRLLFASRWFAAIPVVQLLSIGMAFSLVGYSGTSLLQSHGRFKLLMGYSATCAAAFVAMVVPAAIWGGMNWVAGAVALYHFGYGLTNLYLAMRVDRGGWRDVLDVYLLPVAGTVASLGVAFSIAYLLPSGRWGDILRVLLITLVGASINVALTRWWAKEVWVDIWGRVVVLLRRKPTPTQVVTL